MRLAELKSNRPKIEVVKIYKVKPLSIEDEPTTPDTPDEPECPGVPISEYEMFVRFQDRKVYEETLATLSEMTPEEQKQWASENLEGFVSMKDIYDQAMEEAESYYDREGGYEEFKEKYPTLYYPEEGEDYGAYIPLQEEIVANVANENGNLIIEDEICIPQKIEDYGFLIDTGRGYYYVERPTTPTPTTPTYPTIRPTTNPANVYVYHEKASKTFMTWGSSGITRNNYEFDTGWTNVGNGKKIRIQFGRITYKTLTSDNKIYLGSNVAFRKKGFLGAWYNYKSETSFQAIVRYNLESGLPIQLCTIRHNGFSSHDKRFQAVFEEISPIDNYTIFNAEDGKKDNTVPKHRKRLFFLEGYTADITVTYRGMTRTLTFQDKQPAKWVYTDSKAANPFR